MAIPAAMAARKQRIDRIDRARRNAQMHGLGRGGGRVIAAGRAVNVHSGRPVDVFAPGAPRIQRQAGFFMGPGGGPGGGPFHFPGYTMSGMGLGDDTLPPDVGTPSVPGPPPILIDTSQPAPPSSWFNIGTPAAPTVPAAMAPPNVGTPNYVSNALPASLRPTTLLNTATAAPGTTFGVSNTVLFGGLAAIVGLAALTGGRRGRR
jgi:hypothetical protein